MMRAFAFATLAGVLYFLGFIGFGFWPLVFLFPVALLGALEGQSPRRAGLLGAWAGFVAMCGGYYWLIHLLSAFAGLSTPLAILGYVLLNGYQGLLWGVAAGLAAWASRRGQVPLPAALPFAVVLAEFVFPLLFPSYVAAAFLYVPWFTQIADLGGPALIDGWIFLVGAGLYVALPGRASAPVRRAVLGAAAASVLLTVGYGVFRLGQVDARLTEARTLDVALIQANLGAAEKTTRRREFLTRHQEMSRAAIAAHPELDLLVWPEAAFNRAIPYEVKNVGQFITVGIDRPLISGAITVKRTPDERLVYNSAILTSSTGDVRGIFDKVRLLSFGETIPFVDRLPWLKKWFPRTGTFDRGTTFKPFVLEDGTRVLPMICYEDLQPDFVREMWNKGGPADLLVNVTNDSWYGDTHEPKIHLALATLRAIETRRTLIRSTNTGISALVDPAGRITARTGQWTQEVLHGEVAIFDDGGRTVYLWLGDWPGWLSLLLAVGLFVRVRRSRAA